MDKPLKGYRIAIPETRELNLLAQMLEERGATAVRCPLVQILDTPDAEPVEAWLRHLVDGHFDDLIFLTGEGIRRLLGFAQRNNTYDSVVAALGKVRKITRGPKPARALREIGLTPDLAAEHPTTDGVIATLARHELGGRRFGVQLYGGIPNPKLVEFLEQAGATVQTVAPYIYAPKTDEDQVAEVVRGMGRGEIHVIAFTSAAQVERLWEVAQKNGLQAELESGIARMQVAAVGPVVAEELRRRGATVHIEPEASFFMRPMVNEIVRTLSPATSSE